VFSIDKNEISIKRVVRKNGQSIYRINNQTNTRQEVLSLLAQAGIDPQLTMDYLTKGTDAYFYSISLAQTILFTNLVICELMFVYTCTSNIKPFYLFPNRHLFWATGLSLGLQLLILYTPIAIAFHVVPLNHPYYWIALFLGAFSVSVVDEIRKYRMRLKIRKDPNRNLR